MRRSGPWRWRFYGVWLALLASCILLPALPPAGAAAPAPLIAAALTDCPDHPAVHESGLPSGPSEHHPPDRPPAPCCCGLLAGCALKASLPPGRLVWSHQPGRPLIFEPPPRRTLTGRQPAPIDRPPIIAL